MMARMMRFTRHNKRNGWLETLWINLDHIKSIMLHQYPNKDLTFSTMQVTFIGEKEILTLEDNEEDKQIAQAIIKAVEISFPVKLPDL